MIGSKGITLLEILIAISLFSVVIIGAIGLFTSLIKNQQALLDRAFVLNTLSYSTEYMSLFVPNTGLTIGCVVDYHGMQRNLKKEFTMALIKCSECQKEVSSNAAKCPPCGHPLHKVTTCKN